MVQIWIMMGHASWMSLRFPVARRWMSMVEGLLLYFVTAIQSCIISCVPNVAPLVACRNGYKYRATVW